MCHGLDKAFKYQMESVTAEGTEVTPEGSRNWVSLTFLLSVKETELIG